jgi:hypothetical protein
MRLAIELMFSERKIRDEWDQAGGKEGLGVEDL